MRTGWSERWDKGDYFRSGPFLTAEACRALVQAGAALVGIGFRELDEYADLPAHPAHTILLEAEIPQSSSISRDWKSYRKAASVSSRIPPAIEGGTSFPVRAFAITE